MVPPGGHHPSIQHAGAQSCRRPKAGPAGMPKSAHAHLQPHLQRLEGSNLTLTLTVLKTREPHEGCTCAIHVQVNKACMVVWV